MHATRSLWHWTLAFIVVLLAACGSSKDGNDGPIPSATISIAASVPVNAVVTLSGSGTSNSGKPLTYSWVMTTRPTGSAATISDVTAAIPTFTPDLVGGYSFSLTVSDSIKSTVVTGSTTAVVTAPPTIITDIVEPLSGTVQLGVSTTPAASTTVTWTIDGTALGTGATIAWDTTTVANGTHVIAASLLYAGNYTVPVTRTVQVTQSAVSFNNTSISASNGQIAAVVGAASANGIVIVSATLDGVALGSLAVPNACTDSTGVTCASTGLNAYSFSGAVAAGAHVVTVTATDGTGNRLGIQLRLTV